MFIRKESSASWPCVGSKLLGHTGRYWLAGLSLILAFLVVLVGQSKLLSSMRWIGKLSGLPWE